MKQKQITTCKATIVVIDMPEDVILEEVNSIQGMINFQTRCLGPLSQVTEDQWKEIVDQSLHTGLHPHYVKGINPPNTYCYEDAAESGLSLLRAHGVVLENPLGVWNGLDGRPQTFPDGRNSIQQLSFIISRRSGIRLNLKYGQTLTFLLK